MEAQKKSARRACAAILAAAALWGVIGIWNRRLMAAGLSPTSIVTVRNCGGMVLLGLVLAVGGENATDLTPEVLQGNFDLDDLKERGSGVYVLTVEF